MRFGTLFSRLLLPLVVACALFSPASAQQIEMPDGEAIVAVNTFSETSAYRLTATRSTIYSSKFTAGAWSKGKQVYQTIPARRIVDAAFKSGEIGDTRTYAVLLENGETMVFSYNGVTETFAAPVAYPSPFVPQGNAAYRKILIADDIAVQFGSTCYRNQRDGSPWKLDTAGISRLTIADITLDDRDALLAATSKGVWKFNPTAGNWTRLGATADTLSIASVFGTRNGRIFAGTANRSTWVSADHGATWTRDSAGIGVAAIARFGDDAGNTVYAATSGAGGGGGGGGGGTSQLYRRTLTGASWERIDSSLRAYAMSSIQNIRITDLSGEAGVEVATLFGCYTGATNGDSWTYSTSGIMAEDIYGVQMLGTSTVVSTGLGVYHKQGTGGWTKVFPVVGYAGTRPLIRSDKAGVSYFQLGATGGGQGGQQIGQIYKSTDNGASWTIDTAGISAVPASTSNILAPVFYADRSGRRSIINSSGTGVPLRLYSANPTWAIDTAGMGLVSSNQQTQAATAMHTDFTMTNQYISGAIFNQIFAVQDAILFKRAYAGGAWTVDTAGLNKAPIVSITSDKSNTYCGSTAVNGISSIFRKNAGVWEKIVSPPSAVSDARALTMDSNGVLYVAYSASPITQNAPNRGVYATSDNGATWQYAGLDSVLVRGLVATSDAVYAFTSRGTYKLGLQVLKAASIQFSKHEIAFPKLPINTFKDSTITITNSGNDTLRVSSFRAANQQVTAFSVNPPQFNLAPGKSLDVTVRFAPTAAGVFTTTLRSVANTLPDTILVSGEGLKPNAEMQLVSKQILFDAVTVGATADSVIEISNPGTDSLIVTSAVSNDPVFTCKPTSFRVPPGGKTTITLSFTPSSATNFNGRIRFTTNIGIDSITVFGTGNASSVREDEAARVLGMSVTPNPSAEAAAVRFTLPAESTVRLELVNAIGEKVSTVFAGDMSAGEHSIPLTFAASGTYFVRLVTPQSVGTVQVAVIR
ncbi:MAG: choice-of-anchor D domain-containing protein [Candidatus Kapaibacterium sp.]